MADTRAVIGTHAMTMGDFRELTSDVPDDWPVIHVHNWGDGFTRSPADASVNLTEHQVEVVSDPA